MKKNDLSSYSSRGVRNKNPFNIKRTSDKWKGALPLSESTDNTFVQFANIDFGIRAGIILLRNYISMGYDTVDKIIYRYAPPNENFTQNYIGYVECFLNGGCDLPFSAPIVYGCESVDFYHLCAAICDFESDYKLTPTHFRKLFSIFPELNNPI